MGGKRFFNPQLLVMKSSTLGFISLFLLIAPAKVSAQVFASSSEMSIVFKSDSNTRSVLLSDLLVSRAGNLSPIIGSATWSDNGKRLQCRSLLSFDFGAFVRMINPDFITKAELIMAPLELREGYEEQPLQLAVRRVVQPWSDSVISWSNQPLSDTKDEAVARFRKKKDQPVKVNVTAIVKKMFILGNNGFMICYGDSLQTGGSSHWFASAKYNDQNARPLLLITYNVPSQPLYNEKIPALPLTARDRELLLQMYVKPDPVVVSPPPVVNPKSN